VVDDHSRACGQLMFSDGLTDAVPEYKSEDTHNISGRGTPIVAGDWAHAFDHRNLRMFNGEEWQPGGKL